MRIGGLQRGTVWNLSENEDKRAKTRVSEVGHGSAYDKSVASSC